MWEEFLIRELLWQVDTMPALPEKFPMCEWRAPSWSWVCADYKLSIHPYQNVHWKCHNQQEVAESAGADIKALKSGQLTHASLTLRGRLVEANIRINEFMAWQPSYAAMESKYGQVQVDCICFVFDRSLEFPYKKDLTFMALMTCHCTKEQRICGNIGKSETPSTAAGMLRRLPTYPTSYSHIGVLRLIGHKHCKFYTKNQSVEAENIVVI